MGPVRYFVFRNDSHWLVTLEGRTMAHVATRQEAINSAMVMADLMGAMHHEADVMLEENGELSLVWTHGADRLDNSAPRRVDRPPRSRSRSHVKSVSLPA